MPTFVSLCYFSGRSGRKIESARSGLQLGRAGRFGRCCLATSRRYAQSVPNPWTEQRLFGLVHAMSESGS